MQTEGQPTKLQKYRREHYRANREKYLLRHKKWRQENADHVRAWYRAYGRKKRAEAGHRLKHNLGTRVWGALKHGSKSAKTFELLGCPVAWLEVHLESLFRPGMTWENYGPVWQVDHVRPCADFDLTCPEQQRICFHWTNLQPLFSRDNRRKSSRKVGLPTAPGTVTVTLVP